MFYYNFNIPDYYADAGHLGCLGQGIYRQLIDWYFLDEKPIPLETQVVMRRLRLDTHGLADLQFVLDDFFIRTEKGYLHARIERDIQEYRAKAAKNRVNGNLGGRPRKTQVVSKKNPRLTEQNPTVTLTKELLTNNINTIRKKNPDFFAEVPSDLMDEYRSVRKSKRAAAVSKTVYDLFVREAAKANITVEQAVRFCVERSYVGFKADWWLGSTSVTKANDLGWRNDDSQVLARAKELKIHTQGKTRFEILAKIDEKLRSSK